MKLRREQVVLILTLALLGWMARGFGSSSTEKRGRRKGDAPELSAYPAPPVSTAVSDESLDERRSVPQRALFVPPSDTRPLPPLAFEKPPSAPLFALSPPPVPGPAPAVFGRFLRTDVPSYSAPDLFGEAEGLEDRVRVTRPRFAQAGCEGGGQIVIVPRSE